LIKGGFSTPPIEKIKINKIKNSMRVFATTQIKNKFLLLLFEVINHFSDNIWSILYVVVGAYLVYSEKITIGAFVSFVSISTSVSVIAYGLLNSIYLYSRAKVSYQRYKEYLGKQNKLEQLGEQKFSFNHEFRINNLTYSYPGSTKQVLNDVSFVTCPKDIIRIKGENGVGKTTLANILARWIVYNRHEIYIDGASIFDISIEDYRKNVSFFYQDVEIFNDTLIENIVLSREYVDLNYVGYLINQMNLNYAIDIMPMGLQTYIGEGGYQLSAGNIQKVGIVRVLSAKPKIVIFDEPTTNLDKRSKNFFIELISKYAKENQALVLIITHDKDLDILESKEINFD